MRAGFGAACACLALTASLASGCTENTGGKPVATPPSLTEPTLGTTRPTVVTPPTTARPPTSAPLPSPAVPPGAITLRPDSGYVYIETKSGKTRCQITIDDVGCEAQFANSPVIDGMHANGVQLSADGQVRWLVGNLGDIPVDTLDYRTYSAVGWTIVASSDNTRFTNDRTHHGMTVSVESVEVF
jgi:hypothetical protein